MIVLRYVLKLASGFHTSHLRGTGCWSEKIKFNPDRLISSAICLPCEFWHVSDFPSAGFPGFSVLIFPASYFVVKLTTIQAGFWLVSVTSAITHHRLLCIINHAHCATASTPITSPHGAHDDVMKWKPFPHCWSFVRGIYQGDCPHKWPVIKWGCFDFQGEGGASRTIQYITQHKDVAGTWNSSLWTTRSLISCCEHQHHEWRGTSANQNSWHPTVRHDNRILLSSAFGTKQERGYVDNK